jgi:tetratricopeptide (TPR) repeat protein
MSDLFVAREAPETGSAPGRLVILKTLRPPYTKARVDMFLDEARLGTLFAHPNVVRTFAAFEDGGRHYMALEFLDGQPVDRLLARVRSERLPLAPHVRATFFWMLAESLAGLHYAHELSDRGTPLQIVHRDFTPHNVFVTYDGAVKTLDFGIAKATGAQAARTTIGETKGKVRYMAPEQALGLRVDRRADIFTAGLILWELDAGAPFWSRELADGDVFDELVGGDYPVERDGASGGVNAILRRALARDAAERYRTAEEMREDLLAEIGRFDSGERLRERSAALVSEIFRDQRVRTETMIANAIGAIEAAPAAPAAGVPAPIADELPTPGDGAGPTSALVRLLRRVGLTALLLAAVPASARAGEAEPAAAASPERATEAEQHFQRGVKLFDDGDYKLALVEFQRSYELVPVYRVLYNIGSVEFQLGRYANARRTLTRYLEAGGDKIPDKRRADVLQDLEALKIRTAQLRLVVDVPGADVLLDGEPIGRSPLADRQLVDAGAHRLEVRKNGFATATESVTLAGGDDRTVDVHLTPAPTDAAPRVVEVRDAPGLGPVWIGWALTAALGVATVATLVAWQNADAELTDLKNSASTRTERESQARSVDTLRTTSIVVGAAALVVAGVSLYFTLRRVNDPPKQHTGRPTAPRFTLVDGAAIAF